MTVIDLCTSQSDTATVSVNLFDVSPFIKYRKFSATSGSISTVLHQENVPFVFGVFVSRKVSLVTLALGNLSLSVSGFGKASSALNFYL